MVEVAISTLRNRNPDVLTCIANLSNDEVFTPPDLVNQMLDMVAAAWADAHSGANLWGNSSVRFLDPFTKSGVFLREIVKRLTAGLESQIPDLQDRVDHILKEQVFGIALTTLTALLARRSVYCSKWANGKHSIATKFDNADGNIWFERTEHTWEGGVPIRGSEALTGQEVVTHGGGRCKWCSAPRSIFDRDGLLETHAYKFIHGDSPKSLLAEVFGEEMQFDVVIGNPPYQMTGGGGGTNDSSIYQLFVEQAIRLEPRFLSMVVPSRWLAGGRGLDEFRKMMLTGRHISHLVDYTKMSTAFPGVDFEGGVGYFLWDEAHDGDCEYTLIQGQERHPTVRRDLGAYDIFIRDDRALSVLEKIRAGHQETMDAIISSDTPFGLATNFSNYQSNPFPGSVAIYLTERGRRTVRYTERAAIRKNTHLIDCWKVLIPEAYGERGAIPAYVLGPTIVAPPGSICTQTYLVAGPFASESEATSVQHYAMTRLFRFLVSLRKITQHALRSTYSWVPQQAWDVVWTDESLYEKYGITEEEVAFIEAMVRPMVATVE